jgi:hypothetical protein
MQKATLLRKRLRRASDQLWGPTGLLSVVAACSGDRSPPDVAPAAQMREPPSDARIAPPPMSTDSGTVGGHDAVALTAMDVRVCADDWTPNPRRLDTWLEAPLSSECSRNPVVDSPLPACSDDGSACSTRIYIQLFEGEPVLCVHAMNGLCQVTRIEVESADSIVTSSSSPHCITGLAVDDFLLRYELQLFNGPLSPCLSVMCSGSAFNYVSVEYTIRLSCATGELVASLTRL